MKKTIVAALCALLFSGGASADVVMLAKDIGKGGQQVKLGDKQHRQRSTTDKATGSVQLTDVSGMRYFFNTNITFSTSSSASGAASEASYTAPVVASTSGGGTTTSTLNDAFDGYNTVCVSLTGTGPCQTGDPTYLLYLQNGPASVDASVPATPECTGRQYVLPAKTLAGVSVQRKLFVPTNDTFARWLNIYTNTTGAPITFNAVTANNLGSDANTRIVSTSSGDAAAQVTDTWVSTFQLFSGNTSSDPRIGHVLGGPGAPVGLNSINFADGDDNPFWSHALTLQPGQTRIIAHFVTTSGSRTAVNAKAAALTAFDANQQACMSAAEIGQVVNFATDMTPPTVSSIVRANPSPTNAASVDYTVTFDEAVTGVDTTDFTLTPTGTATGTVSNVAGSGTTYTVTVSAIAGQGTLRLDLNGSGTGIADLFSNAIATGYTAGETYTVDRVAPAVTSIALAGTSPTNLASVAYTVTFDEAVTGVDTADFTLTTTGSATGTIASVSGSGTTYTVTVNAIAGQGTLRLDLNASGTGIVDALGNPIATGFTTGQAYTIDRIAPTATSIVRTGASPTNATSVGYTVTFSENVTFVDTADFTLTATGTATGTIASVSGSGTTYAVTINGVSGEGTLRLDLNASGTGIQDAATNPIAGGFTGGEVYTIDSTAPAVTSITRTDASPTNAASVGYTVTFSDSVTGVDASDFTLTTTGTAAGTVASVSGSGTTYTVTVNGITGQGTLRLDLNASGTGIVDGTSNPAGGFAGGETYTIDRVAPTVTSITASSPGVVGGTTTLTFTVTFPEPVTGVDLADFELVATGSARGTLSSVTGSGTTYTVTVTNLGGDGTLRLDLDATGTGIVDALGNPIAGGFTGTAVGVNVMPPVVVPTLSTWTYVLLGLLMLATLGIGGVGVRRYFG